MQFSPQQVAVFDWVRSGRGSAFVEAVAGAGKTTTIIEACKLMRGSVAFAAYNKKIATEIEEKVAQHGLGTNVRVGTFHSFGLRAWRSVARHAKLDARGKQDAIADELSIPAEFSDFVAKLVSLAKNNAVGLFGSADDESQWWEIVDHHDLTEALEDPRDAKHAVGFAQQALAKSREMARELIDFDDMVYMPVVTRCRVWQNDWLLVDEAQDINPARRALARKMLRPNGRAVFVGDSHQAIYGFCHPPGTPVLTPTGHVAIELLKAGDPVITAYTDGQLQGWKGGQPILQTHRYYHTGMLLTLHAGERRVSMTPHHKVPARVDLSANYYTYMMRRAGVYRVGCCKAYADRDFMLTHRCCTEKADAAWILGSHPTKEAALEAERRLLVRVKGETFQALSDDEVRSLPTDEAEALKILAEHGRMVDFPMISDQTKRRFAKNGPFVTEACNLMDGMRVAFFSEEQVRGGKKGKCQKFEWTPITITARHYSGEVHGITVTPPAERAGYTSWPLYFAGDDVLVHNTGADAEAVSNITREFRCTRLPLTVTYRCPKAVVAAARDYVSHIDAHESAPDGLVRDLHEDDLVGTGLSPSDAILCRLTAPLVKLAFKLIKAGIGCHVEGRDIGAGLLKLATRWSRVKSVQALRERLEEYVEREVEKLTAKGQETKAEAVQDRVDTLLALLDGCKTLDDLTTKITELFTSDEDGHQNTLTLSTVHKSKGREWDRVFVLGFKSYMPSRFARQAWQLEQENNLIYVAFTRAKRELVLVDVGAKAEQPAPEESAGAGAPELSSAA